MTRRGRRDVPPPLLLSRLRESGATWVGPCRVYPQSLKHLACPLTYVSENLLPRCHWPGCRLKNPEDPAHCDPSTIGRTTEDGDGECTTVVPSTTGPSGRGRDVGAPVVTLPRPWEVPRGVSGVGAPSTGCVPTGQDDLVTFDGYGPDVCPRREPRRRRNPAPGSETLVGSCLAGRNLHPGVDRTNVVPNRPSGEAGVVRSPGPVELTAEDRYGPRS